LLHQNDSTERHSAEAKFWVLYYGPLVMVEAKDVDEAMVSFGRCVSGYEKCSRDDLKNRSLGLASTLEASMLKAWNAKPNEFTRNQEGYGYLVAPLAASATPSESFDDAATRR
jgi:hypothetical protein